MSAPRTGLLGKKLGTTRAPIVLAEGRPYADGQFKGRIAYSCDGNHNDRDDWIASPVTLAILAESGVKLLSEGLKL